jgi:hypothetical protein
MGRVEFFRIMLPARTRWEVGMFPNNSVDQIRTVSPSVGGWLPEPCQWPPMTSLSHIRRLSPVSVRSRNTIADSSRLFHPHRSHYSSSSSSLRRPIILVISTRKSDAAAKTKGSEAGPTPCEEGAGRQVPKLHTRRRDDKDRLQPGVR